MLVQHIPRKSFAPKSAVAAKINFTPSSQFRFLNEQVSLKTNVAQLLKAMEKQPGVTIKRLDDTYGGQFSIKKDQHELIIRGGGTKDDAGFAMDFSISNGLAKKTISDRRVSLEKPAQLPAKYAKVFQEGLTLDLGSKKVKVNLGEDIHAVAERFGVKAVDTISGAGWGPGEIRWGIREFVRPAAGQKTGYEFSLSGTGEQQHHNRYTVLAGLNGKVDRIWANAESFPIGEIPFVNRVALENQGGKAELSLSESRSLIKNGIVNRARTFTGNEGVEVLTRTGL